MSQSNQTVLASWRARWNQRLLSFLGRRVRASVDIEDLAQETYLRLLRAPDLNEVRNPQGYLLKVASNVVAEWHHNKPKHELSQVDALEDLLTTDQTPDLDVDLRASQQRLDDVLQQLSPTMRAVMLLRLRDDRSCKDIARDLSLSDRQVKRHLVRGYDLLRRALEH